MYDPASLSDTIIKKAGPGDPGDCNGATEHCAAPSKPSIMAERVLEAGIEANCRRRSSALRAAGFATPRSTPLMQNQGWSDHQWTDVTITSRCHSCRTTPAHPGRRSSGRRPRGYPGALRRRRRFCRKVHQAGSARSHSAHGATLRICEFGRSETAENIGGTCRDDSGGL